MKLSSLLLTDCDLPTVSSASGDHYVSVEAGCITGFGPMEDAPKAHEWRGRVVNASGRSILPGFVDAHAHVVEAGVERLRCDMSECALRQDVINAVAAAALQNDNEWIVGRGWDMALFDTVPPSLEEIDRITRGRPAYLNNANGHCVWVNSEALSRAGIHRDSPDPEGGLIGRDDSGALTGMLYESAMNLVNDLIPPLSESDLRRGMLAGEAELHRFGVTAWQEAIVGPYVQTTDVFSTLRLGAESGELRSRVTGALWWPRDRGPEYVHHLTALRESLPTESRFRCSAVKIMYDGSAATQTAAMREPYSNSDNRGITFFDRQQLIDIVSAVDAAGFDAHIHANGDRAVVDCLDAIEQAIRTNTVRERRHQLAHLHFLDDNLIVRMAQLGVVAVVQPLWAHRSKKMQELVLPGLNAGQAAGIYRYGSLTQAGVTLASSSDWPVSTPDPWQGIQVAVNRHHPSGVSDLELLPNEGLNLKTALQSATQGAAYAIRRENKIGSIAVGKAADLIVLSSSVYSRDSAELYKMEVDQTFIDGEVVFSR